MQPEILHTRRFREQFLRCLSRYPSTLTAAVPYIGRIPGFSSGGGGIVDFSRFLLARGNVKFRLITAPPGRGGSAISGEDATGIVNLGVDLMIRDDLHSKVYQFSFVNGERAAFVGSANFSRGGFERNCETVAFFRSKADNDAVGRELERIAGYGASPFALWNFRATPKKGK